MRKVKITLVTKVVTFDSISLYIQNFIRNYGKWYPKWFDKCIMDMLTLTIFLNLSTPYDEKLYLCYELGG